MEWEDDKWVEIMMKNLPAPDAILSLVKCNCEKAKCSTNHCSCRPVALYCTELCGCDANEDTWENLALEAECSEEELQNSDIDIADDADYAEHDGWNGTYGWMINDIVTLYLYDFWELLCLFAFLLVITVYYFNTFWE